MQPFDDIDDLVRDLKESPDGLAASVWATDVSMAMGVASHIQAGRISINSNRVIRTETPFGGVKQSGVGKDLGRAGLDTYLDWKSVFVPLLDASIGAPA